MNHKKRISKPEIGYVLPELSISGGIAIALYHILELRKLGRNAIAIVEKNENNGDWFPHINEIPVISLREYEEKFGKYRIKYLTATWWETSFTVERMNAEHKFFFLQSLENRFYPEGNSLQDGFFLSLGLGLNIFTEAKWIRDWLRKNLKIDAIHVPNGLDTTIFHPGNRKPNSGKLRVLIEGAGGTFYKGVAHCFEAISNLDVEIWYVSTDGVILPEWKVDRLFTKIPQSEMQKIYSECDVLLKMSKVEGVFGPPLEMMACGGTCVVGNVSGHDEYCENERNCLIIDKDSPGEARNAILRLMNDREFLKNLQIQGPVTAKKFQWKKSANILNKTVYSHKIKKQSPERTFLNQNLRKAKEYLVQLEETKILIRDSQNQINLIYSSLTWKIGEIILYPARIIRNFFSG
ncbi:MAG: glycosyltransferase family 4 protein [Leptospira sp.]|nr:glycosyltransferase family 4 protein [Leptospira sp.]